MELPLIDYVKKSKQNDQPSLEFLIQKFQPLLIKYALKLTDFEDAKSELVLHLIKTIQKIPLEKATFTEDRYILSYIKTSIERQYINISSKQRTLSIKEFSQFKEDAAIDYNKSNIIFYDLIKNLSAKEQLILEMKFVYNCTNTEISRNLNLSRQNVQACLTRVLIKLRKQI